MTNHHAGACLNDWDNSYVEDDYTLVLKYTKEYGPSVSLFCQGYIYDKDWCATATEEDWFSNPVGTGPYTVKETAAGSHVTFIRKSADQYWGELPECEEVTYHKEPSESANKIPKCKQQKLIALLLDRKCASEI